MGLASGSREPPGLVDDLLTEAGDVVDDGKGVEVHDAPGVFQDGFERCFVGRGLVLWPELLHFLVFEWTGARAVAIETVVGVETDLGCAAEVEPLDELLKDRDGHIAQWNCAVLCCLQMPLSTSLK